MIINSQLLERVPGILHGFGTLEEPLPRLAEPYWDVSPRWKQVHGIGMAEVKAPAQECGEVDVLSTRLSKVPISVVTADCVPVLMCRRDGKAVAAAHAGWRGTRARILEHFAEQLKREGENLSEWVAAEVLPSVLAAMK